ncbi:MAG: hypothetical protein QM802_11670 [Agriterribacter sp.]
MQKLNQRATKIFCHLLSKLKDEVYIRLSSDGFMPLSVECIANDITTPYGAANLYSLSHTYTQNGDLMRDPEMCFFVIDKRGDPRDYHLMEVYPQMYRQDNLGLYEESVSIEGGKFTIIKAWQKGHCNFANQWMKNIKEQGFLQKPKK